MIFSADETTDVGADSATPVSDDYGPKDSAFTGRVRWVQLDIDEAAEDLDHLIITGRAPPDRDGSPIADRISEGNGRLAICSHSVPVASS